jgi:Rieske Fe-S protein
VLLVGLVVDPTVIAPLGGAIAATFGFLWLRSLARPPRAPAPPEPKPPAAVELDDRGRKQIVSRAIASSSGRRSGSAGSSRQPSCYPAAGFAVLPSLEAGRRTDVDLGPIGSFPEGSYVVTTFLSDPQAGDVSRRSAYVRYNGLLGRAPSFTILSSRCNHVGCPTQPLGLVLPARVHRTVDGPVGLAPAEAVSGFSCPCHGSAFDDEGNRTAGPAPRALDRYQFSIRNGHLVLGELYSVSRVDGGGAQAAFTPTAVCQRECRQTGSSPTSTRCNRLNEPLRARHQLGILGAGDHRSLAGSLPPATTSAASFSQDAKTRSPCSTPAAATTSTSGLGPSGPHFQPRQKEQ